MGGSYDILSEEDVLQMGLSQLRNLTWLEFGRNITPAEIRHILEATDALWLHSGDQKSPHAELTSGKCSDGFVDTLRMLRYTNLCEIMAKHLVRRLRKRYDGRVDWVIGSDHAGATLSYEIARQLGAQHDFAEKGPDKTQVWKRFTIEPDEVVLQAEELVTTTGTLRAVREGIQAGNVHPVTFAPVALSLVHRSDAYEFEGAPIDYLTHYDIKTWDPKECPLCAGGSERLRPKDREHWGRLTGKA